VDKYKTNISSQDDKALYETKIVGIISQWSSYYD
jgi:hypothetical protein